jgi:hypothetical protein
MSFFQQRLRKSLFGIPPQETDFARRGFHIGAEDGHEKLERSASSFVQGYHAALEDDCFDVLTSRLTAIAVEYQGFAFEGAAMGLSLLDYFSPWKRRLATFSEGPGAAHLYMLYVGAGWTLGRLPRSASALRRRFDPLLGWLALDGYGFHQGFFSWQRYIQQQQPPAHLSDAELHVFDQGLGRSLWFVKGATTDQVIAAVAVFPQARQSDLWSGVGLAAGYAGGVNADSLQALYDAAGFHRLHLAQGAAFAAKARQRAGNLVPHTDLACRIFSGLTAAEAAQVTDESLQDLPTDEMAYAAWRSQIRLKLAEKSERV